VEVLIIGAGVIGTVYGAHLGAAGHVVSVLGHPTRTDDIAAHGLAARDVADGRRTDTRAHVVPDAQRALRRRGFAVQGVTDMDGWLAYHAAFVACVAAALYRRGTDAARLAADRRTLTLMCAAVTEAFAAQPLPMDALASSLQHSCSGIRSAPSSMLRRLVLPAWRP
jgi:ketopantoate reductase